MDYDLILARYGEIGLKSRPVRRRFERVLQENIEVAFERRGLDCIIQRAPGRFFLSTSDIPRALEALSRIFGLTSVSPVRVVPSDLATLLPQIARFFDELAAEKPGARTFAIRPRRSGQHPYSSQDVAREGGGAVLDRPGGEKWKVDLSNPDIEVFVEVRDNKAYLFGNRVEAPGGLPMGSQGKVVVLLKDLHSLVAAWLMMKRGCTIVPVHFTGPTGSPARARAMLQVLRAWNFHGELIDVAHEEANEFPRDASCALCMRQMIRKAEAVARRRKAKALVTGESFSSSTIENLTLLGGVTQLPILRPLLGITPDIVGGFSKRIGIEAGRNEPFFEPCPLRTHGRVERERVQSLELELGLEARAHAAVRPRPRIGVAP